MIRTDKLSRAARRVAALASLAACVGCGGAGDEFQHFPVKGTVRHDGQPLKAGTISFIPGGAGASGSSEVVDGAFALDGADGLSPGEYRVEVYSVQPTGRKVANPDDPEVQVDETAEVVDRRFNIDSTLKVEVPPGGLKDPISFEVASPRPGSSRPKRR